MSSTDELKSSLKITRVRLKLFKPLISFVKRCNKTRGHLIFLHFKLEKPTECHSFMSRDRSQIIEKDFGWNKGSTNRNRLVQDQKSTRNMTWKVTGSKYGCHRRAENGPSRSPWVKWAVFFNWKYLSKNAIQDMELWSEHRLYKISGLKLSVLGIVIRTYNRIEFLLGVFTFSVDSHYEKRKLWISSKCIFNMQFQ